MVWDMHRCAHPRPSNGQADLIVEGAQASLNGNPGQFNAVSNSQLVAERNAVPFHCLDAAMQSLGNICGGKAFADVRENFHLSLGE